MSNIKVKLKIKGASSNYEYNGLGSINRDILSFKDDKTEYMFDFKVNRITEISKDRKVIIDLEKKEIRMDIDDKHLSFDIDDVSISLEESSYKVKYELEGIVNISLEWSNYE
jgi:hypothetical protein